MDFDKVLEEIGEFGRYQKIKYYLLVSFKRVYYHESFEESF